MINLKKLTFLLSAAAFMHYHIQGMGQKDLSRLTQTSPALSAWQRFESLSIDNHRVFTQYLPLLRVKNI